MGCCVSSRRKPIDSGGYSPDHPPDDDHHHSDNRPPPNLALMSSVRTLRSHLAMSPPSSPFHRPEHDEEEILYPINPKHVSSSNNPRLGRYGVGNSQIAAFDVDRAFIDLSTTSFNFSKEVHLGGGERTPSISSMRLGGSGRWSIDSPTPVPLAEIWKRRPPPSAADTWENKWDPPGEEFLDTSSSGDTSMEMRSTVVRVMEGMNNKMPRKVTFKDLPKRKESDGPGPGLRAARRVARSRVGGWSPPEVSRSFDDGMFMRMGGSGRGKVRSGSVVNDDVLVRERMRNEYDSANDLMSMEGFIFF